MDNEVYVREFNLQLTDSLNKIHHLFVNMFFFLFISFSRIEKFSFFHNSSWFSVQNESIIVTDAGGKIFSLHLQKKLLCSKDTLTLQQNLVPRQKLPSASAIWHFLKLSVNTLFQYSLPFNWGSWEQVEYLSCTAITTDVTEQGCISERKVFNFSLNLTWHILSYLFGMK